MSLDSLSPRDRRGLMIIAATLVIGAIFYLGYPDSSGPAVSAAADDPKLAQMRLTRLRHVAATVPSREATMKQVSLDLAEREKGILQADTAAQGQAALLEIARRVGKEEQLDVRGGDFATPKAFGDYGLVYATVTFDCHVEQLVNFLADLARQPELIVPSEEHITAGSGKEKLMGVRIVLAGVVPKKLVPEKKGLGAF
jgi:hypothetical protein